MTLSKSDGLVILLLSAVGLLIILSSSLGVNHNKPDDLSAFIAEPKSVSIMNINRASYSDLVSLPGVGPELAKRILSYRMVHGPFDSVDELTEIKGIGLGRLNKITAGGK